MCFFALLVTMASFSCEEKAEKRTRSGEENTATKPCQTTSNSLEKTALAPQFNVRAGEVASRTEYRGIGMLWLQNGICTGSLICPNVVLTAAHCVDKVDTEDIEFHLAAKPGKPPRRPPEGYGKDTRVRYVKSDLSQDIALIKLDRDVEGPYVDLAADNALNNSDQLKQRLTIVGYGLNKGTSLANSSGSGVKRYGTVLFNVFLEAGKNGRTYQAATFSPVGGLDDGRESQLACAGDSGGPILKGNDILGVVNVGINLDRRERGISCETGDAVTFSLVKEHRTWIERTMEDWCSAPLDRDSDGEKTEDRSTDLRAGDFEDPSNDSNPPKCLE